MTSPHEVVERIKLVLSESGDRPPPEEGPNLARTYAGFCKLANDRLRLCDEYLKKGMQGEALHVAEEEPALLDYCAALDFVGAERWREVCRDRHWPIAEPINARVVAALNEAYASGVALEPLLREYRLAVREGNTRRCINLLRKIATLDPQSKHWAEDLRNFEQRRLSEIREEVARLPAGADVAQLAELLVELETTKWSVPGDQQLREAIAERLRQKRQEEALAQGRRIVAEISAAYAALDFNRTGQALEEYRRLRKGGYFVPDNAMVQQYEEALEWYEQERRQREEEQLFSETVAKLKATVERGSVEGLSELLNLLVRFDRPVPDKLEERAQHLLAEWELERQRTHRLRLTLAAVGLVALVLSGLAYWLYRQYKHDEQFYARQLELAIEQRDRHAFEELCQEITTRKKWLSRSETIRRTMARKPELVKALEEAQTAFRQAQERLLAIKNDGFQEAQAVIENLIAQAQASALCPEHAAWLRTYVTEWRAHRQELQAKIDNQLTSLLNRITEELAAVGGFADNEPAVLSSKLGRVRTLLEEAEAVQEASEDLRAQVAICRSKLGEIEKGVTARESQKRAIAEALSLTAYLDQLLTYVKAFPNEPFSRLLAPVAEKAELYRQLVVEPQAAAADNPFWFRTVQSIAEHDRRLAAAWKEVREKIVGLEQDKELVELYEVEYCENRSIKDAWKKLLFRGRPSRIREGNLYEGECYEPDPRDQQPDFTLRQIYADQLRGKARLAPHCELVAKLVSGARFATAEAADMAVVDLIDLVASTNAGPPLGRLRMLTFLIARLEELVGAENLPGWNQYQQAASNIDERLSWICELNRDVQTANQKAMELLSAFEKAGVTKRYRAEWAMRRASLKRNVKWVGYISTDSSRSPVIRPSKKPKEIWVLRPKDGTGSMQIVVAEEQLPEGPRVYTTFLPAEPLFAPTSGATRDLLQKIKAETQFNETKTVNCFDSWPANLRQ